MDRHLDQFIFQKDISVHIHSNYLDVQGTSAIIRLIKDFGLFPSKFCIRSEILDEISDELSAAFPRSVIVYGEVGLTFNFGNRGMRDFFAMDFQFHAVNLAHLMKTQFRGVALHEETASALINFFDYLNHEYEERSCHPANKLFALLLPQLWLNLEDKNMKKK